jgi:transposase
MKSRPPEKAKKTTDQATHVHWNEMNRKQRREMMRKIQSADLSLEVVHPNAAGIDIGNESHYVAVPPDRESQPVRRFGCTTAELKAMADWLNQCGICTVAMQSTGVYWIAAYDILEQAGLEVYLVNARDTKNLPGHKSDVQESQWLMKLHTYGLLRNSFRPSQEIRTMRTYWRQRNDLVQSAGRHILRMQKVLTQMNIQLANVLSDISGVTGQAIIKAILKGERDPHKLAALRDPPREGGRRPDRAVSGGQLATRSDFRFAAGAGGLRVLPVADGRMRRAAQAVSPAARRPQARCLSARRNAEGEAQKEEGQCAAVRLARGFVSHDRTDLTQIDGVDVMTAMTILSEAGWDMSKWETESHFVSWLRLCPDNRISGDRIIGKGRLPTNNRASIVLKMAATSLRESNTYLGAQFRRLRTRLGPPIAIKAMAAKLARLVYRMLRYGMKYVDRGVYQAQHRRRQIRYLNSNAAKLGFRLVEVPAP